MLFGKQSPGLLLPLCSGEAALTKPLPDSVFFLRRAGGQSQGEGFRVVCSPRGRAVPRDAPACFCVQREHRVGHMLGKISLIACVLLNHR